MKVNSTHNGPGSASSPLPTLHSLSSHVLILLRPFLHMMLHAGVVNPKGTKVFKATMKRPVPHVLLMKHGTRVRLHRTSWFGNVGQRM